MQLQVVTVCTPGLPWKSSGYWDFALPMQGAQVQTLVGKIPHAMWPRQKVKKKKKKRINTLRKIHSSSSLGPIKNDTS